MRVKQVIVVRTDLNMRKGKIAAQVAHASMKVFLDRSVPSAEGLTVPLTPAMAEWLRVGVAKVVLGVTSEEDLLRIHAEALRRGIPCALVTDSGKTEFHGVPTRTTVALGPDEAERIDPITGPEGVVATRLL